MLPACHQPSAASLTRALDRQTRLPYARLLARLGEQHQIGAGRQQRLEQLTEVFRVRKPAHVRDRRIILIDDVATTGEMLRPIARLPK